MIRTVFHSFDLSTFLEMVIGLHLAVEVYIVLIPMWSRQIETSMTRLLEPSRVKTKVYKFDIDLLVDGGCRCQHLVVDAHRVACVAGQLYQDIHDMIVASGGSHVLF